MMEFSPIQQATLLDTARDAIRRALAGAPSAEIPADADPALLAPVGCFVTLHDLSTHHLRGCVGRIDADEPLLRTIQLMAAAALEDSRFSHQRVTPADLPALEIDLSILSPLSPAAGPLDFEPTEDGIVLTFGQKTGCFLPQVGQQTGWTREQLLDRLCTEKMGLSAHIWKNPYASLKTFRSIMVGPEPFNRS